ncbi:MAG TPA: T9SS type A sorting domain-containing protein [Bacteroidales bacterium]|jgi:hypothetical protein|nr:T9SS type A sorting domain-containing protein [Bacteroidales bacterium]
MAIASALLRYEKSGTADATFGNNGLTLSEFFGEQDEVQSVALDGNDKIYVGGKTLNSGSGIRDFTVARYTNDLHTSVAESGQTGYTITRGFEKGLFTINTREVNAQLEIYDNTGRKISSFSLNSSASVIDLSGQPNGVYLYRLTTNGKLIGSGKLPVI